MVAEISQLTGAQPHECSEDRINQRNGYRDRPFDPRVGIVELAIPKLRKGSYKKIGAVLRRARPPWERPGIRNHQLILGIP